MNVACKSPDAFLAAITSERIPVGSVSDSVTDTQYAEIDFRKDTITGGYDNFSITVSSPGFGTDYTLTNETPEICTLTGDILTRVTDGIGILLISRRGWKRRESFVFAIGSSSSYVWTGFAGDSVTSTLSASMKSLAAGGGELCYFSNYTQSDIVVTRNPDRWFTPDLSGSAIATDIFGGWSTANSGALITPRHYIGANHWLNGASDNMGAGKRVMFAEADGTTHIRTVLARYRIPYTDLILCALDSDLPAGIVPFSIAGNWMVSTVDGVTRINGLGFKVHQEKIITLCGFDNFAGYTRSTTLNDSVGTYFVWANSFNSVSESDHYLHGLTGYLQEGRLGDSGGVIGTVVNGDAVLVSLFYGPSSGYLIYEGFAPTLNAAIATVDALAGVTTGYTVTIAPDPTS